jgi:hypothetical protein
MKLPKPTKIAIQKFTQPKLLTRLLNNFYGDQLKNPALN